MLGVGIILIAFGLGRVRSDWDKVKGATQGSDQIEREFGNVSRIDIDLPFGSLYISAAGDDEVYFSAANVDSGALKIRQDGEKLEICADGKGNPLLNILGIPMGAWADGDNDFTVAIQEYFLYLPADYAGQLNINFGTGKVGICDVTADTVEISLGAGELVVEACRARVLDADCDIGKCTVKGDFEDISVETNIGALDVRLYGSHENYEGTISCGLGEMEYHMGVDFEEIVEYYIEREMGDGYLTDLQGADLDIAIEDILNNYYGVSYDTLLEELGIEEDENISWIESWDRRGGIALEKTWKGKKSRGKLEVDCGVGDVAVTFLGAGLYTPEFTKQLQSIDGGQADVTADDFPEEATAVPDDVSVPEEATQSQEGDSAR